MAELLTTDERVARCWIHRWTPWKDYAKGTETFHFGGSIPVVIQERRCTRCNMLEQRTVRP